MRDEIEKRVIDDLQERFYNQLSLGMIVLSPTSAILSLPSSASPGTTCGYFAAESDFSVTNPALRKLTYVEDKNVIAAQNTRASTNPMPTNLSQAQRYQLMAGLPSQNPGGADTFHTTSPDLMSLLNYMPGSAGKKNLICAGTIQKFWKTRDGAVWYGHECSP